MPRAHEVRAQLRKFAFVVIGIALHQCLAGDEAKHGVPKKLELLVVTLRGRARVIGNRIALVRMRTVSERLLQQFTPQEGVAERGFKRTEFEWLHEECVSSLLILRRAARGSWGPPRAQS